MVVVAAVVIRGSCSILSGGNSGSSGSLMVYVEVEEVVESVMEQ